MNFLGYKFEISPLSEEDGGGYLINFPQFNQLFSDGDTVEEALKNGEEALQDTLAILEEEGWPIPGPDATPHSGKLTLRVPMSLHARLVHRAEREGVSLNTFLVSALSMVVQSSTTPVPTN